MEKNETEDATPIRDNLVQSLFPFPMKTNKSKTG